MKQKKSFYAYFDAQRVSQKLEIKTYLEYQKRYKEDPQLPYHPNKVYAGDWENWTVFLGIESLYKALAEAKTATRKLEIKSCIEYWKRYKEDPQLPRNPNMRYAGDWISWSDFLDRESPYYKTLAEAKTSVQKLEIKTQREYLKRYKEDPQLPSEPRKVYAGGWTNWTEYFGGKPNYKTLAEAKAATRKLEIKTSTEYWKRYKEDPQLPCNPCTSYAGDWVNWADYLDRESPYYKTLAEAKTAVQKLEIEDYEEYRKRYKEDPKLPYLPNKVYASDWIQWADYLDRESPYYKTLAEATTAVQKLEIKTIIEYRKKYKEDPKLPYYPNKVYAEEWSRWEEFLIPSRVDSLIKAKTVVQIARIRSAKEYAIRYKALNPSLPRHPDRVYREEWIDWYDFLGIHRKTFYTYKEASNLLREKGISTQLQYDRYRVDSGDSMLYKNPSDHYEEWINWFVFLGNDEPFQPSFIRGGYTPWRDAINNFMYKAKGGTNKKTTLCKFERHYIEKYKLGYSPVEFLSAGIADKKLFNKFLDEMFPPNTKNTVVHQINEFLNYILRTDLTVEDEDTGELVKINDAKNPFERIYVDQIKTVGQNETVKPRLQFQFLQNARKWIVPDDAKTFSDLNHLYEEFDSDWYEISPNLIDESDPNCIVKKLIVRNETKYYIWSPINWMHTYVLMEFPLRGVQIAYNDSGEGDTEIPVLDETGKIFWRENDGPLAGQTKNQSMVKKYPNNAVGCYSTTNKTSNGGHSVPWIPEKVAYWLIRLRDWQAKYNPIKVATSWTECKRTNFSPSQLKAKGRNCFLFRGYGQVEAITYQSALSDRIAVSLYHTQPDGITLATCESGKLRSVSHYESDYSPHAMRVGLISAFVFEYGLPIEIIMKIVGHSSIVMSIYYCKVSSGDLIKRMEEGEKKALKGETDAIQRHIEQQRIEAIKNDHLISNSKEILSRLNNSVPGANFTFSDIGICPFANSRCNDGGKKLITQEYMRQFQVDIWVNKTVFVVDFLLLGQPIWVDYFQ